MKFQRMLSRGLLVALMGVFLAMSYVPVAQSAEYNWRPSSWLPSGITWNTIGFMSDYVERMSDGRIEMEPSEPGAIVPVDQQLSAVASGTLSATFIWPGYFPGQIDAVFAHGEGMAVPKNMAEMRYLYEEYKDGRIMEILREEYAKMGVHLVGNVYWTLNNIMISKKPIEGIEDIDGLKFRTSELISLQLAELGAGTVWTPGDEIYTMLSTGGVDAVTFSHAKDDMDMGFHEVTKYWVKYPKVCGPAADALIVNKSVWESMPDDLKAILEAATEAGSMRNKMMAQHKISKAWDAVEEEGIEIIEWSEEDAKKLSSTARDVVPEKHMKDEAFQEIYNIIEEYAVEQGYWEEE